ncbi:AAA domain-containing protein [Paracoccus sp. p4-l81]|uniref:AAA domain-containing protein n=1 Tax=Paracoccus sp. p4-l81 TaxID=3342806 RepID=UPI0035B80264
MKITNAGRGVHKREIKGVDRFKNDLPASWYAFTNLDLVLGIGRAREIDVVIVSDRRIFLIDLKDWYGTISSVDGRWHLNGVDRDPSPVAKIAGITREILPLLAAEFKKRPETKRLPLPRIEGLVVLTGKADRTDIAETEKAKVLNLDEFLSIVKDSGREREAFGNVPQEYLSTPLTDTFWKERLHWFFNAGPSSPFKPGRRRFERFSAEEVPTFAHPQDIYREYEVSEEGNKNNLGTLRLWDFANCPDARFQNEEGRLEIAGREQVVYHWLKDRSNAVEQTLLPPKIDDPERGVHYWEIYDRRRRMQRLGVFAETEAARLAPPEKIELARQILASVANLHTQGAAHLDLGSHSIWLEAPTTAKLSHLMAARFPEVKSLGEARYQFLASVGVPEDHLGVERGPQCRDVFLAAVAVHQLLFGKIPDGDPPEWNPEVDEAGVFYVLHDWFAEALELDPFCRFKDATHALKEFNHATAQRPTRDEIISGLDRHRGAIRTVRQLMAAFPETGDLIVENDYVEMWRSQTDGAPVTVKLWKQALWGDTAREGAAILAFLDKAAAAKADRPEGFPKVLEAIWLGNAIAVVQEWVEGPSLAAVLAASPEEFGSPAVALTFLLRLTQTVDVLHQGGLGHGDISPANIIVSAEMAPALIDALDFSPRADGERTTSAYAPVSGGIFERDRFAVTRIAEEVLAFTALGERDARDIAKAVADCREKEPYLSTLLPLLDQIEAALARLDMPAADDSVHGVTHFPVSIVGAATGPIEPDEGYIFLRVRRDVAGGRLFLVLRGAAEELDILLDNNAQPVSARRRKLEQRQIKKSASQEFHMVNATLSVESAVTNDFSALASLLVLPEVQDRIASERTGVVPALIEAEDLAIPDAEEAAEDALAEEIGARTVVAPAAIDVPALWRAMIDVENELTIEGIAQNGSIFDRGTRLHKVPIELESGAFEFARHDIIGVERQDRKGGWRRIGQLDLQTSRSDLAVIDASDTNMAHQADLVDAGQRLRFWSHLERQSLKRRTDAVDRILAGNGRSRDLLGVFDPRAGATPVSVTHRLEVSSLGIYGLNPDQEAAFARIVANRPVGLLQGPPGTGKTRFIAALTHYALTKGLARNVLLSSQSHEAVNTAAEAVLSLFRNDGIQPSLLRIARDEEQVSLPLRAYHTPKVEQSFKDRFRASFRDRLAEIASTLGLPDTAADEIAAIETTIRPLAESLAELKQQEGIDQQRLNSMLDTMRRHLDRLELATLVDDEETLEWSSLPDDVAQAVMRRHTRGPGADRWDKLYRAAVIGQDFTGSVSRSQRSFESFLAGTRQIVAGTCVGLGRNALGLTTTAFDLVIVDEAARCTASELLVPLQAARWAVLVGDHAQLEPQHKAEVVNAVAERTSIAKREIKRSDFERVFMMPYGTTAGARLTTQYRMLPPIGQLVSEAFYPEMPLHAGREVPEIDPLLLPAGLDVPLLWIETDGMGEAAAERPEEGGKSRVNRTEADAIVAMLEDWHSHEPFRTWLLTQQKHPAGIGVICMYAAQRDLIRRKLRQSALAYLLDRHLKVGTVDSYQGKENPVVLLSLVRNNEEGPMEAGVRRVRGGFLTTPNRINVAVSRAMDRLVVVGVRRRWPAQSPMGRMVDAFERQATRGTARALSAEDIIRRVAEPATPETASPPPLGRAEGGTHG